MASVSRMLARNWLPRPSPWSAGDEAGNVDEFDDGRLDLRLDDFGQGGEAGGGHFNDADVGLDGAERVVLGGDAGLVRVLKRSICRRWAGRRCRIGEPWNSFDVPEASGKKACRRNPLLGGGKRLSFIQRGKSGDLPPPNVQ